MVTGTFLKPALVTLIHEPTASPPQQIARQRGFSTFAIALSWQTPTLNLGFNMRQHSGGCRHFQPSNNRHPRSHFKHEDSSRFFFCTFDTHTSEAHGPREWLCSVYAFFIFFHGPRWPSSKALGKEARPIFIRVSLCPSSYTRWHYSQNLLLAGTLPDSESNSTLTNFVPSRAHPLGRAMGSPLRPQLSCATTGMSQVLGPPLGPLYTYVGHYMCT